MDGNLAMNSQFENMSEKDMEQQEKTVWVDQGWPKKKNNRKFNNRTGENEGYHARYAS